MPPSGAAPARPSTQTEAPAGVDAPKKPQKATRELIDKDGAPTGLRVTIIRQADGSERADPTDCVLVDDTLAQYQLGSGEMAPCHDDLSGPAAVMMIRYSNPECIGEVYIMAIFPFEKFGGQMYRAVTELKDVGGLYLRTADGNCVALVKPQSVRRFAPIAAADARLPNPPYTVR